MFNQKEATKLNNHLQVILMHKVNETMRIGNIKKDSPEAVDLINNIVNPIQECMQWINDYAKA